VRWFAEDHEVMGNHASGAVFPSQWVLKSQRSHVPDVLRKFRCRVEVGESLGVLGKWVAETTIQEEAKPPGPSSSGPDQSQRRLLKRTSRSSPVSRSIAN